MVAVLGLASAGLVAGLLASVAASAVILAVLAGLALWGLEWVFGGGAPLLAALVAIGAVAWRGYSSAPELRVSRRPMRLLGAAAVGLGGVGVALGRWLSAVLGALFILGAYALEAVLAARLYRDLSIMGVRCAPAFLVGALSFTASLPVILVDESFAAVAAAGTVLKAAGLTAALKTVLSKGGGRE